MKDWSKISRFDCNGYYGADRPCVLASDFDSLLSELRETRKQLKRFAIDGNPTEMWSHCRICDVISTFNLPTSSVILKHKPECLLSEARTELQAEGKQ